MTKSHVVKERYGSGGIQSERGDEEYTTSFSGKQSYSRSEWWGSHSLMLWCSATSGHVATMKTVVGSHTALYGMPPTVTRQDHCICSKAGHNKDGSWGHAASSGLPPLEALVVEWWLKKTQKEKNYLKLKTCCHKPLFILVWCWCWRWCLAVATCHCRSPFPIHV